MAIETHVAKHVVHDNLEAQLKSAEAKLETIKARAQVAKANAELKAITTLITKGVEIRHKLEELKKAGDEKWEQKKSEMEHLLSSFEKSVKEREAKVKASSTPS